MAAVEAPRGPGPRLDAGPLEGSWQVGSPGSLGEALELAAKAAASIVSPEMPAENGRPPWRCEASCLPPVEDCRKAAAWLLGELDQAHAGTLPAREVAAAVGRARAALSLPSLAEPDLYLSVTVYDERGANAVDAESLGMLFGDLLSEWGTEAGQGGPWGGGLRTPRASPPAGPPPSPAEVVKVVICTLGGTICEVELPALQGATTEDLELALARSPQGLVSSGAPPRLAFEGRMLETGDSLQEAGLFPGCHVVAVRTTPPPQQVRLQCEGVSCGPSIRGSCGTFRLAAGRSKNGKPVYVRDSSLSSWNAAMLYHGKGIRYLLFEEHAEKGGRWAITDDQDWVGYGDRCYAFVPSRVPHPGYLEGKNWHVYKDSNCQAKRVWLEHDSLRLVVEDEPECRQISPS